MQNNNFSSEYLQSELPAIEILEELWYEYIDGRSLNRDTNSIILEDVFIDNIKRLNDWISEDNIKKVVRILNTPKNTDLMLVNKEIYEYFSKWISITQDLWKWNKNYTVKLFDYDNLLNNDYKVINQFKIKMREKIGIQENDIPDVLVFVNWIPLWVLECKAPTIENALKKWINQLERYQNEIPKLFWYANMLISCAGTSGLLYWTTQTPASYYLYWKTLYPFSSKEEAKQNIKSIKSPTPQDLAIYSIFHKENFLDILRNFTIYETENQRLIKKVPRYQQFQAVRKIAEKVIKRDEDGWVVWHTQGSGKSLTMLYTALKLKRLKDLNNPTILIVTDRNNLDTQISWTFLNAWFENPIHITNSWNSKTENLKKELSSSDGKTIITTIQSFQDKEDYPLLSDRENIIVCVDEAHRTQYGLWLNKSGNLWFAGNMRKALPNAFFIAFTGTPIEKTQLKNTKKVFGSYIDTYKITDAVQDWATVSVKYELRFPGLVLDETNFEDDFEFLFWYLSDDEKKVLKQKYGSKKDLISAPERIKSIAKDIIRHYRERIEPNGFKAMVVASSRENAVMYKKFLDELNWPESVVIISWDNNDSEDLKRFHISKETEDSYTSKNGRFNSSKDPLKFIIVNQKLLTWFDAPICQVMYLDNLLKEHELLQAIARTNRNCTIEIDGNKIKKTYWLVVDYAWIWSYLTEALEMFDNSDVKEGEILESIDKDEEKLQEKYLEIKSFFKDNWLENNNELEDYLELFENERLRGEYKELIKDFNYFLDELLPNNDLIEKYKTDLQFFIKLSFAIKERFRETKDEYALEEAWMKVKKLINDYIRSFWVKVIVDEVDILDIDFKNRLKQIWTKKWEVSELREQLKNVLNINISKENPVLYKTLAEKLNKIINDVKEWIMDIKDELDEYYKIRDKIIEANEERKSLDIDRPLYAIYSFFKSEGIESIEIVKNIYSGLEKLLVIWWVDKESSIKDIQKYLKIKLYELGFEKKEELEKSVNEIIEILKLNYAK